MATINTGSTPIAAGQIVQAEHVLPIVKALNGEDATDIIIDGNVTFAGSGVVFNTQNVPLTGGSAHFDTLRASLGLTAGSGSFSSFVAAATYVSSSAIISTNITASRISASTEVLAQSITGSNVKVTNTLAFTALGTIITGSGSVPIITHTVTESGAVGNGLTFGGSQFRNYLFHGSASPRVGIGASNAITTASLASGSFITGAPGLPNQPATMLITSSDEFVIKVATNARSQSFSISGSGFVGINTWAPREALDIQLGNAAIKNPTTTSGSILYVENAAGRILDVTNFATNSIFTVQNPSGLAILDVGTNSAASSYVAVTGTGGGVTPALSSSFTVVSASMALMFRSASNPTVGSTDIVVVATGATVTLPTATAAGVGRYYIIRNAGGTPITVGAGSSTVSGITSLGPTSASHYISDGIGIWYSI